jgi:hypothetical protein
MDKGVLKVVKISLQMDCFILLEVFFESHCQFATWLDACRVQNQIGNFNKKGGGKRQSLADASCLIVALWHFPLLLL